MPKVKRGSSYIKNYTEQNVENALADIKKGLSTHKAAAKHGVPRSTLQFRLSDKCVKITPGPAPVLGYEVEKDLVKWIHECSDKGFPRRKENVQATVKEYLDENEMETVFKDNFPGEGWYKSFLKRNPSLTERFPEGVTTASSCVSEKDIRKWFSEIHSYLVKENYFDILKDPTRVFNSDETYFMVCPKLKHVLAPRGSRNVYEIERGNGKLNLTVLFTFSAKGVITPPTVVYPYQRLPGVVGKSVPSDWGIGVTPSGWMCAELFVEYLKNIFHPYLEKQNVTFPVILFVDGHSSHLTLEVSKVCSELEIILICLYPNSTRILQPADVSAFKPIKSYWKNSILEWRQKNPTESVTMEKMAPLLKIALEKFSLKDNQTAIASGFKACGLCPWNPDAVNYAKCLAPATKQAVDTEFDTISNTAMVSYQSFAQIIGPDMLNQLKKYDLDEFSPTKTVEFFILQQLLQQYKKSSSSNTLGFETTDQLTVNSEGTAAMDITKDQVVLSQQADINVDISIDSEYLVQNIEEIPIIMSDDSVEKNVILTNHTNLMEEDLLNIPVISSVDLVDENQLYEVIDSVNDITNTTSDKPVYFSKDVVIDNERGHKNNQQRNLVACSNDVESVINSGGEKVSMSDSSIPKKFLACNEGNETEVQKQNTLCDRASDMLLEQSKEVESVVNVDEQNSTCMHQENEPLDLSLEPKKSSKPFSQFLQKPPTPKRKGIRFTEKKSYAITSSEWRSKEEEKINKQKLEMKRKEARKLEIQEKKKVADKIKAANKIIRSSKKENAQKNKILNIKKEKVDDKENAKLNKPLPKIKNMKSPGLLNIKNEKIYDEKQNKKNHESPTSLDEPLQETKNSPSVDKVSTRSTQRRGKPKIEDEAILLTKVRVKSRK